MSRWLQANNKRQAGKSSDEIWIYFFENQSQYNAWHGEKINQEYIDESYHSFDFHYNIVTGETPVYGLLWYADDYANECVNPPGYIVLQLPKFLLDSKDVLSYLRNNKDTLEVIDSKLENGIDADNFLEDIKYVITNGFPVVTKQ